MINFKIYWMDKNFTTISQSKNENSSQMVALEYEPEETSIMLLSLFARMYPVKEKLEDEILN